jgi:hypothetical protein
VRWAGAEDLRRSRAFIIPHSAFKHRFRAVMISFLSRGKLAVNLHSLPSMPQFWVICEGDSASSFVIAARIFCQKRIVYHGYV